MKGYKGFNQDLTCRGYQYEVGKEYEYKGDISICESGFHFCKSLGQVHGYYDLSNSRFCEVEAIGKIIEGDNKCTTDRIRIIRELTRDEISVLINTGSNNTGFFNSGNWNSGDYNSGNWNSGSHNSGDYNSGSQNSGDHNSGDYNSGHYNSGHYNSGDRNSGNQNSGNRNSGNRNSGDFNSCSNSAGVFMSKRISYEAFNQSLTDFEFSNLIHSRGYKICIKFRLAKYRVRTSTGKFGDFKHLGYKDSWAIFWNSLSFAERYHVRNMPHIDKAVFEEITGVKL
jgi:hypothetical protein